MDEQTRSSGGIFPNPGRGSPAHREESGGNSAGDGLLHGMPEEEGVGGGMGDRAAVGHPGQE